MILYSSLVIIGLSHEFENLVALSNSKLTDFCGFTYELTTSKLRQNSNHFSTTPILSFKKRFSVKSCDILINVYLVVTCMIS
jgi:hypothetical protein